MVSKNYLAVFISSGLLLPFYQVCPSVADDHEVVEIPFVNKKVTPKTNIHFSKYYCSECHLGKAEQEPTAMRFDNYTQTCRCHNYTPETYTHPVGIVLSEEKKTKIPDDFPLENDSITCATCHIMILQCRADSSIRKFNRSFLRVSPLPSRTAICYKCHDERKYRMLDPHRQLGKNGKIIEKKCLYCHRVIPNTAKKSIPRKEQLNSLASPIGELDALCYRCHFKQVTLHPINADHLKKPSLHIARIMKRSERQLGIIMPLTEEGYITCVTCHNPHEKGVLDTDSAASGGAGESARLRVTKRGDRICIACHQSN